MVRHPIAHLQAMCDNFLGQSSLQYGTRVHSVGRRTLCTHEDVPLAQIPYVCLEGQNGSRVRWKLYLQGRRLPLRLVRPNPMPSPDPHIPYMRTASPISGWVGPAPFGQSPESSEFPRSRRTRKVSGVGPGSPTSPEPTALWRGWGRRFRTCQAVVPATRSLAEVL